MFWDYAQETQFGARLHDIRHKFAIERLKEGWSVYRVQRYIGHGSPKTTERYYFRYLSPEQQAIAKEKLVPHVCRCLVASRYVSEPQSAT